MIRDLFAHSSSDSHAGIDKRAQFWPFFLTWTSEGFCLAWIALSAPGCSTLKEAGDAFLQFTASLSIHIDQEKLCLFDYTIIQLSQVIFCQVASRAGREGASGIEKMVQVMSQADRTGAELWPLSLAYIQNVLMHSSDPADIKLQAACQFLLPDDLAPVQVIFLEPHDFLMVPHLFSLVRSEKFR